MIRFNELQQGSRVLAEYEGQKWEGTVKELKREDNKVCVETEVQEFWFTPEHLFAIPLDDAQMSKLGFSKLALANGVKYSKDAFRLQLPRENDFTNIEMWYREDRRELKQSICVHELQNHYYQMTKVELNPA